MTDADRAQEVLEKHGLQVGYGKGGIAIVSAHPEQIVAAIAQAHAAGRAEGLREAADLADEASEGHRHQMRVYTNKKAKRDFESMGLADAMVATAIRARITTPTGGKA